MSNLPTRITKLVGSVFGGHQKLVYGFSEGSVDDATLLGRKGANLCEMERMRLPVPSGFIVTTDGWREFQHHQSEAFGLPGHVMEELRSSVNELEKRTGRIFGKVCHGLTPSLPLIFAVRSSSAVSMPGMLDTVLNVGINDAIIEFIADTTQNFKFAYGLQLRFIQSYGSVVCGIPVSKFESISARHQSAAEGSVGPAAEIAELKAIIARAKELVDIPEDPWVQLAAAIAAVFGSWHNVRAVKYRRIHNISEDMGTAVIIQSMVFGNRNNRSGSGVCFSRNPTSGKKQLFGEYWPETEGDQQGVSMAVNMHQSRHDLPLLFDELTKWSVLLEQHFKDLQEVEFTVENGNLFILQTRPGKRTAKASVTVAVALVREQILTEREALLRINPYKMDYFLHPSVDLDEPILDSCRVCKGIGLSVGAVIGGLAFTSESAVKMAKSGVTVILCKEELTSDDVEGIEVSSGVLLMKGNATSHPIVLARGQGKSVVVAHDLGKLMSPRMDECYLECHDGKTLSSGELVTIDGAHGDVYRGSVPTIAAGYDVDFVTVLAWADRYKRIQVFADVTCKDDVANALLIGADGLGDIQLQHIMSLPNHIDLYRKALLSTNDKEISDCTDILLPQLTLEFASILETMEGCTVRFNLDFDHNEFFPDAIWDENYEECIRSIAATTAISYDDCLRRIQKLAIHDRSSSLKGCRTSILFPSIAIMHAKAIVAAAASCVCRVSPEIVLPLVCSDANHACLFEEVRTAVQGVVVPSAKFQLKVSIGCSIEVPRGCERVARIMENQLKYSKSQAKAVAGVNQFDSIMINSFELTKYLFGFDEAEFNRFKVCNKDEHLFAVNPFTVIDEKGVGQLLKQTVHQLHSTSNLLKIGLNGVHSADPSSIHFAESLGIHFVSCLTKDIPTTKLAAAQAAIRVQQSRSLFGLVDLSHNLNFENPMA